MDYAEEKLQNGTDALYNEFPNTVSAVGNGLSSLSNALMPVANAMEYPVTKGIQFANTAVDTVTGETNYFSNHGYNSEFWTGVTLSGGVALVTPGPRLGRGVNFDDIDVSNIKAEGAYTEIKFVNSNIANASDSLNRYTNPAPYTPNTTVIEFRPNGWSMDGEFGRVYDAAPIGREVTSSGQFIAPISELSLPNAEYNAKYAIPNPQNQSAAAILQNSDNLWFRTGEVNQSLIPGTRQFDIIDYNNPAVQKQLDWTPYVK